MEKHSHALGRRAMPKHPPASSSSAATTFRGKKRSRAEVRAWFVQGIGLNSLKSSQFLTPRCKRAQELCPLQGKGWRAWHGSPPSATDLLVVSLLKRYFHFMIQHSLSLIPPPSLVITAFQPPKWDKWLDADFIFVCCP